MKTAISKGMGTKVTCAFVLIMSLLFSIYLQNADAESPQHYIDIGEPDLYSKSIDRALLAYGNFVAAKADSEASGDPVINFYLAFTRMLYYAFTSDPTGVEYLLWRYGVSRTGDDEYTLQYDLPLDENDKLRVPGDAPTGETVRAYLHSELLSAVDESISNLDDTILTWETYSDPNARKHIAPAANTNRDENLEIDYGDILLFRACLKALKSVILIASAYDMDIDLREIAALQNLEALKIKDILNRYQQFLTLLPDSSNPSVAGEVLLDQARLTLIGAIDDYLDASFEILHDPGSDAEELIEIDECDRRLEEWFRTNLTYIKDSLTGDGDPVVAVENKQDEWLFTYTHDLGSDQFRGDFEFDMSTGEYSALTSGNLLGSDGDIVCVLIDGDYIEIEIESSGWPYSEVYFNGTFNAARDQITGSYSGWNWLGEIPPGAFTAVLNSSVTETDSINLNLFFDNDSDPVTTPFDLRDFLPDFDQCDQAVFDTVGYGLDPDNPDPTLGGIFPYYTQDDWEIDPEICTLGDATVNGNLSVPFYTGEGTIFIQVFRYNAGFDTSPENRLGIQTIYAGEFTEGMSYEIPYVESGSDVFVSAWLDLNSNGILDAGEPEQFSEPFPLTSGSTLTEDFTIEVGFTVLGSVINVRGPTGDFQTLIEVAFTDDFAGNLPEIIDTLTIETPGGGFYDKNDLTYHAQFKEFYIFLPGSPEIGIYTFTVTGDGVGDTATDHQYVLRTLPLQDTSALSPAAGAVVSAKTPTFKWGAVEYESDPSIPLYYRLEICADDGGAVGPRVFATGRVKDMLYYTLPTDVLTPGDIYWWRVRVGDSGDWIKAQNRVVSDWLSFTVADPLSPHSNKPAIDPDGWGVLSWTYNLDRTGTEVWVRIYDHDGVASNGSSHSVTVQRPGDPQQYSMEYRRSYEPNSAAYEFWFDDPPLSGVYTFRVTDPDGNVAMFTERLNPADVNPLDPPDASSITPSVLTEFITAAVDDISVRKDGVLEPYEDFNSYSSIDDIDWSKWEWFDNASIQRDNGNGWLVLGAGNSVGRAQGVLSFADPQSINEIQAQIKVTGISEDDGLPKARIRGTWFNDGTSDIGASISVNGSRVFWSFDKEFLNDQGTYQWADSQSGDLLTGIEVGNTVTLSISWNGTSLTFSATGAGSNSYTYTPTANVGPPVEPEKSIQTRIHLETDTTPTFTWDPVSGANRYRVQIYNYDNSITIWRGYTGNENHYTVPPGILKPNAFYRFRIEAWDSQNPLNTNNVSKTPSSSNNNYIFYTVGPEDNFPFINLNSTGVHVWNSELLEPFLNFFVEVYDADGVGPATAPDSENNIDNVKVVFPDNTTEVSLEYRPDFACCPPTATASIYYATSPLPIQSGSYKFIVEDKDGHQYEVDEELTVDPIGYPSTASLRPLDGATIGSTAVHFDWEDVEDAPGIPAAAFYRLIIYDYDYKSLYVFDTTKSELNLQAGFLEEGRIYRWRVYARREFFSQNIDNGSSVPANFFSNPTFITTPITDSDGDGMPDYWENEHGLNPGIDDRDLDPDDDDLTNDQEFQKATNPQNNDTDGDGVLDGEDALPLSGYAEDNDNDGTPDGADPCPYDPDDDADGDGICGDVDNCPNNPNPGQADLNGDGWGDVCDDIDGDGVNDNTDEWPIDPDNDIDDDTFGADPFGNCEAVCAGCTRLAAICQEVDNCPGIANNDQADSDSDGIGDVCDIAIGQAPPACHPVKNPCEPPIDDTPAESDADGDGIPDTEDLCPNLHIAEDPYGSVEDPITHALNHLNTDNDGSGDACDDDDDNDTILDAGDNCRLIANTDQADRDCDGIGDVCDDDKDGDGVPDAQEIAKGTSPTNADTDDDGISDGPEAPACPAGIDPGPDDTPTGETYSMVLLVRDASNTTDITTAWLPQPTWNGSSWSPEQVTLVAMLKNPSGEFINFSGDVTLNLTPSHLEGIAINTTETYSGTPSNDLSFDAANTDDLTRTVSANNLPEVAFPLFCFDFGGQATVTASTTVSGSNVQLTKIFPLDSDGDGLPDAWENRPEQMAAGFDAFNSHSFSAAKLDGDEDIDTSLNNSYDGDGLTNFREFRGVIKDPPGQDPYHEYLNSTKKDLFVRGDNFANSIPPNTTTPHVLPFLLDYADTYNDPGGKSAFEEAGIVVHNVTGMPSFVDEANPLWEPPNIDILVVTNKTEKRADGLIETLLGLENGYINHPSSLKPRYWTWDLGGASFIGNAQYYAIFYDPATDVTKRGTQIYHLCKMNYQWNRPYLDDSNTGVCSNDPNILDQLDNVEDYYKENGIDPPDAKGKNKEDRCVAGDGMLEGDRMDPDWKLPANIYGTEEYEVGHNYSVFDADGDGYVENPIVEDPSVLNPNQLDVLYEYTPEQWMLHTWLHEMGHAVGMSELHTADPTCLMYQESIDWRRAGHFSPVAQSEILIHNKTEIVP